MNRHPEEAARSAALEGQHGAEPCFEARVARGHLSMTGLSV